LIFLQRQQELEKELAEQQFQLAAPGKGGPPQVNICPPSPQNNEDIKTGNFN
jgi:hypothetical protein